VVTDEYIHHLGDFIPYPDRCEPVVAAGKPSPLAALPDQRFVEAGKTYISALKPRVIADYYPDANIETIAAEVERIVLDLVNEAK
jgi:hypothetical protein